MHAAWESEGLAAVLPGGGQAPEHVCGHVCDTSWNDLFCLYPFISLPVCWYVHLSCLLCSQEAPNHVPTGKVMVSETSRA